MAHNYKTKYHIAGEAIKPILDFADQVACATDLPILITGETGTGKELIARRIASKIANCRPHIRKKNLIAVNCGAIPKDLVQSTLFGHKQGSFTGALNDRMGVIRAAENRTLFLDEIGEMNLDVQANLLRLLDHGEIGVVGEDEPQKSNTRIIAATNKELRNEVDEGNFRQDLYYRLNEISIHLPPLRERREDIPILVKYFLRKHLQEDFLPSMPEKIDLDVLKKYKWPGNIRELNNFIMSFSLYLKKAITAEQLINMFIMKYEQESREVLLSSLPQEFHSEPSTPQRLNYGSSKPNNNSIPSSIREQYEFSGISRKSTKKLPSFKKMVEAIQTHKSINKAAKTLGISPDTLSKYTRKYNPIYQ